MLLILDDRLIRGFAMKLKILAVVCVLMLPLSLIYAQGMSGSAPGITGSSPGGGICAAPGHVELKGRGHEPFQAMGIGHSCHDVSPT